MKFCQPQLLRLWWGRSAASGRTVAVATGTAGTGAPVLTGAVAQWRMSRLIISACRSTTRPPLHAGDRDERYQRSLELCASADGHVYTAKIGTLSELVTAGDSLTSSTLPWRGTKKTPRRLPRAGGKPYRPRSGVYPQRSGSPTQTGELVGMQPAPKGKRFR